MAAKRTLKTGASKKPVASAGKKPAEKAPLVSKPNPTKKTGEVEKVKLEKLNREVFEVSYVKALAEHDSQDKPAVKLPPAKAKLEERVKALVLWYRATVPNDELGGCTECGGDSDMRLDACPFCGDSEVAHVTMPPTDEDDGTPGGTEVATVETTAVVLAAADDDGEPATPLAVSEEPPDPKYGVTDLDAAVKEVDELKRDAANSLWHLGVLAKRILEERLWLLRSDEKGERTYRTFKQFVVSELGMSYNHVHRLVMVSEKFTEQEMKELGVSKCSIMLQVPDSMKPGLLQSARDGATKAQLSDAAKSITQGERAAPAKQPTGKALTVAMVQGRTELPLLARPKGSKGKGSDNIQKANPMPARSIGDDPFCIEHLPNNVTVAYRVAKNVIGEWTLIIERRRVKDSDLFAPEKGDQEA